ncbi:MAG: 2-C-methyl-D-erythritol 4-phosphate cytidylyltransferase [bacterium]|jgi:2-C-methyl-D-erythritol 4-phosphate cytidylyltransferase|nr:MAG: 2-C-methyl-D-erythritol 4-phosphate cytidylyltransferase [bacterium]KAF0150376.1 MAG: 2-C-methyl-D-erythritol 4-phosphate cytidylyltransferase [bacterium]KAF0168933.1 MAG: 2-C-methyl-D-erythritol 4-phosphate cytidylyltransferase [bacterium]TXT18115.1 MAG: 2-C-methyl-D-erythritol 4-phosphate cytidylyltransferase [bacterium]
MMKRFALLPAAGVGARMGAGHPKQYLDILGRPMIWHALDAFQRHAGIAGMHVVLSAEDGWWNAYDWSGFDKLKVWRVGGASRAQSVLNGLAAMADELSADDWVLVHDAARPCLSQDLLDKLIGEVDDDAVGGILAMPVADTLKRAADAARIAETVPRAGLWAAQTPQMFRHGLLRAALERAGPEVTDEASALELAGYAPRLVESDTANLKVTYPRDLELARLLLAASA